MFELKKAEKRSVDEWSLLAIYKRYIRLGEKDRAEKLIRLSGGLNKECNLEIPAIAKFINS